METPHRLNRQPVQSPSLVGVEPQSLAISSPVLGDDKGRNGDSSIAHPFSAAVTKVSTSKNTMEKIEVMNSDFRSI